MSNDVHEVLTAYLAAADKHRAASEHHDQKRQEYQAADADLATARKGMFLARSALDSLLEEKAQ